MTTNDLQRAAMVLYAARAAGERGSLEQMKAIAICLRNRVRQGWHGGDWLAVIENADESAANPAGERIVLDMNSRALQRFTREADDLYVGNSYASEGMSVKGGDGTDLEQSLETCCYWCFLGRPIRPWFEQHIIRDEKNHPQKTAMGTMLFYE